MKTRKLKKSRIYIVIIVVLCCFIVTGMYFLNHVETVEERFFSSETILPAEIDDILVYTKILPKQLKRRVGEKREIHYIVIHETDNRTKGADASKHSQFLLTNTESVTGWHYTVDDHQIYHHLPDNEVSWHAGDQRTEKGGNMNGIGIEMCVNMDGDYEQTLVNSAKLIAYLLKAYDLTLDDVKLHRDFSGKICPHRLITENRVEWFYELIGSYL